MYYVSLFVYSGLYKKKKKLCVFHAILIDKIIHVFIVLLCIPNCFGFNLGMNIQCLDITGAMKHNMTDFHVYYSIYLFFFSFIYNFFYYLQENYLKYRVSLFHFS